MANPTDPRSEFELGLLLCEQLTASAPKLRVAAARRSVFLAAVRIITMSSSVVFYQEK
jgi:hypothetical protein